MTAPKANPDSPTTPLWRQIMTPTGGSVPHNQWCAEKLAVIRDRIVPDESDWVFDSLTNPKRSAVYQRWQERCWIRAELTAEIEKALSGE
jgi:hypothetical protein